MQIHSIGIDLGKTTFHLVALGIAGKVLVKKKFSQKQLLSTRHLCPCPNDVALGTDLDTVPWLVL
jgi:hypothetical protein